ncbi:cilia- and flagella-associated protein 100 [Nematostella vectensis]|uniref:cilia- and flagella-associated protein 100 n=1 Tax=Nematostella vectensis TaxID=45351 RepID=UPI0020770B6A|nr:cilia- and flagella-associated protein 100 [Nematostella vectensis]
MSRSPSQVSNKQIVKSREQSASRQSGKVTFPSVRSGSSKPVSALSIVASDHDPKHNPFTIPSDNDIFTLRDKERQWKQQERVKQRNLKVHEKSTYTSRVNAKTAAMRRIGEASDDEDIDEEKKDKDGAIAVKDDPGFTLAITRDRHVEKENLADFIAKKREMFLVQYSLGVKRDEMRKLEEIAQAEEKKLELAEQYLEEDAAMFDEFLKENDKNSVEAIKVAEAETKLKLEKVAEIKKINGQMMAIKSEISKNEDLLKEYLLYKQFLDSLTPQEWRESKRKAREEKRQAKQKEKASAPKKRASVVMPDRTSSRTSRKDSSRASIVQKSGSPPQGSKRQKSDADGESLASSTYDTDEEFSDEEPELFFGDPQQLLDIFAELEEQNLSLIQNSQETEEALEEMKQTIKQTQDRMNHETEILKGQIDFLNDAIKREQERAAELEMKSKMFSYGEFKAEDQEKMLAALNKKVEEVYRNCIGDNEANISTLQMLTNIENRLEELFEQIEIMPPERVEMAEKAKEKERRLRQREEKMEQQRLHQEDRVRRALERAQAEPKRKTGKPLMFRSEPPQTRKKQQDADKKQDKEEEELKYFFT